MRAQIKKPHPELVEGSGVGESDAVLAEQAFKLAVGAHLANNVAAADEFTLDIKLWNGRPTGEFLDALAQLGILQHVEAFELDAQVRENLNHCGREPALRKDRRAFH